MRQELNVGDEVEVTLKGKVYEYPGGISGMQKTVSPNHVAISARGFIHHVHKSSPDIVKVAPPRPALAIGQVWRSGDRTFLAYSTQIDNKDLLLVGVETGEGRLIYSETEFFNAYPEARLLVNADGTVVLSDANDRTFA